MTTSARVTVGPSTYVQILPGGGGDGYATNEGSGEGKFTANVVYAATQPADDYREGNQVGYHEIAPDRAVPAWAISLNGTVEFSINV